MVYSPRRYRTRSRIKEELRATRERSLALLYVRVSTDRQVNEGVSLDAQVSILSAAATAKGWNFEVVREEGKSAKSLNREQLTKARRRLGIGEADVLVALRLDRISRSTQDFLHLVSDARTEGWSIKLLEPDIDMTSVTGEVIATVLAAMARFEREMISQRTREGMAELRARGAVFGPVQRTPGASLSRGLKLLEETGSLSATARLLNEEGWPTARGGLWRTSTIQAINERHAGSI